MNCWYCKQSIPQGENWGNFCDKTCQHEYITEHLIEDWKNGNPNSMWNIKDKAPLYIYDYLMATRERCCENCGIHKWNGVVVKLRVDLRDRDNPLTTEDNVALVCPNCKKHHDD